jgi:signal transduction histidine kinase
MTDPLRRMAHDLNNVFAAILGCADLLTIRLKEDGAARQEAEEIQRAAERGAAITRRLAKMARIVRQPRRKPGIRRTKNRTKKRS